MTDNLSMMNLLPVDWDAPPGVHAVMSTRVGGVSAGPYASLNVGDHVGDDLAAVVENRRRLTQACSAITPGVQPVFLQQVHGTDVLRLEAEDLSDGRALDGRVADASLTLATAVACTIMVADCLPVLFACPKGVAAAHAGWRGLASGVLEQTLQALLAATGSSVTQVRVWLGPCIGPLHFEVGEEVHRAFVGAKASSAEACFVPGQAQGKWLADLPELARMRLQAQGLSRQQLFGGQWCTVSDAERFFSHRRESQHKQPSGRMAACVWRAQ